MEILSSQVNHVAHSALDVLVFQQKLLAENIANANTEGYRPASLNFEQVMATIERSDGVVKVTPELLGQYVERRDANVQLDLELLQMQETVLQYKTLLDALSRRGALMKTVLGGDK